LLEAEARDVEEDDTEGHHEPGGDEERDRLGLRSQRDEDEGGRARAADCDRRADAEPARDSSGEHGAGETPEVGERE